MNEIDKLNKPCLLWMHYDDNPSMIAGPQEIVVVALGAVQIDESGLE